MPRMIEFSNCSTACLLTHLMWRGRETEFRCLRSQTEFGNEGITFLSAFGFRDSNLVLLLSYGRAKQISLESRDHRAGTGPSRRRGRRPGLYRLSKQPIFEQGSEAC